MRWPIVVAVIFLFYSMALLWEVRLSQRQLRAAAETRILEDHRHAAAVLGDFFAEQGIVAQELAESHELGTLLANRALGMSMHYGLNVSLFAVEERFRRKLAQKKALGAALYQRIAFLDEDGTPFADTAPGAASPRNCPGPTADA